MTTARLKDNTEERSPTKIKEDTTERRIARNSTSNVESRENRFRKKSISLIDPGTTPIPSLLDLTEQDFEVNAPVNNLLLQGTDLLTALDINGSI